MREISFTCKGHPNIRALHRNTIEFTKDERVTLNGDCIVGVSADFDKEMVEKILSWDRARVRISVGNMEVTVVGKINKTFSSGREIVIRKSDFISERTLITRADKACADFSREFAGQLISKDSLIRITITPTI